MKVVLPWPPKDLNPNARNHWARGAKAKKAYRHACWALALKAGLSKAVPADAKPLVSLTFVPPDRHARDRDNMLASMKSGLDGLADAIGCDDSRWRLAIEVAEEVGGMVRVEITP